MSKLLQDEQDKTADELLQDGQKGIDFLLDEGMDLDLFDYIGTVKRDGKDEEDKLYGIKTLPTEEENNDHLIRLFSSPRWWGSSLLDDGEIDIWADLDTGIVISQKDKDEIEAKVKRALNGRDIDFEWLDGKLFFRQKQSTGSA